MSLSALEPYGRDRIARVRAEQAAEERWHVRLAADDVKVMTVEQLDDAYRLSIVDSETSVWKHGMAAWQPLGVVAGLDEDSAVEVTAVGPSPHDATPRFSGAWGKVNLPPPPTPPARAIQPVPTAPPLAPRFTPPPRLVVVPSPPPARTEPAAPRASAYAPSAPASFPSNVSAYPASVPPAAMPQTQAVFAAPSVPPLALSLPPEPIAERSVGGFGRALLTVAFLAGTCVTLYRNDVLLTLAQRAHAGRQFLSLEQRALGGPSFGTLRALPTEVAAAAPLVPVPAVGPAAPALDPTPARAMVAPTATTATAVVPPVATAVPTETAPVTVPVATAVSVVPRVTASRSIEPSPTSPRAAVTGAPRAHRSLPSSKPAAAKSFAVHLDDDPEPAKPKRAPKKSEPADAPASAGSGSNLDDAIRAAALHKTPKKKPSNGSEYDPLNPDL